MAAGPLNNGLPPHVQIVEASKTLIDLVNDKILYQDTKGINDPFYVVNLSDIVSKHEKWARLFPRVEPFYAVKCFDDEVVLKLLANLGSGFDCASKSEIAKVLDLGVSPDRIVYANTCKQRDMLSYARDCGVCLMTFDNEDELHKVKEISPGAQLLMRILPPDTGNLYTHLRGKFGCSPRRVRPLLETAKSLGLNVVGISFYVGSYCGDSSAFSKAVVAAASAADAARDVGFRISILDIGGGFPGHANVEMAVEDIAAVMVPALDEHFPESGGVRLIAEPGRFFVASAVQLTAKVIGKRLDYDVDDEGESRPAATADDGSAAECAAPRHARYYINDGIHCSFLMATIGKRVRPPVVLSSPRSPSQARERKERTLPSTLYGSTCDMFDVVLEGAALPEAFVDDWMSFANMGAYSLSVATSFNGMPKPRLYYVAFADALGS